jgi:hypothetical protein
MKSFGRLLNEQTNQVASEFTDQKLKLAYLLSGKDPLVGCFGNFKLPQPYKDPVSGKDALWRINDQKEHVWVFGDGTFEKRDGFTKESKVLGKGNWTCEKLEPRTNAALTPKVQEFIDVLKNRNNAKLFAEVAPAEVTNYRLIDIFDIANDEGYKKVYGDNWLRPESEIYRDIKKGQIYLYLPLSSGGRELVKTATPKEKIKELISNNKWVETKPTQGEFSTVNMADQNSINQMATQFPELQGLVAVERYDQNNNPVPYYLYKVKTYKQFAQATAEVNSIQDAVTKVQTTQVGEGFKKGCRNLLTQYNSFVKKGIRISKSYAENNFLPWVKTCATRGHIPFGLKKEIEDLKRGGQFPYGQWIKAKDIDVAEPTMSPEEMTESRMLSKLVSKSLNEIKLNKKKSYLTETRKFGMRLSVISESVDLNTNRGKDIFFEHVIKEMVRMNRDGVDKQVIQEDMFDMVKGFFSGTAVDSVMQYFKEYGVKWLLGKLGVDKNHWLSDALAIAIGNLPLGEIPKVFSDCNYLTKLLSKTFVETMGQQFAERTMKVDNPISNITRNALVEILEDTRMGEIVEGALGKYVCPLVGDMKGKMGNITDMMKQKAFGTDKGKEPSLPSPSTTTKQPIA